jgi:HSP20 family molecular chaperone IbpA
MHQIIRSLKRSRPSTGLARIAAFRQPHYDCREKADALMLVIYVPGVNAAGVDIEVSGPDITITAPRSRLVRANWRALHLEPVQRDYRLRLRLGFSLDYDALHAELQDAVLTVTIPKKSAVPAASVAA